MRYKISCAVQAKQEELRSERSHFKTIFASFLRRRMRRDEALARSTTEGVGAEERAVKKVQGLIKRGVKRCTPNSKLTQYQDHSPKSSWA